MSNDQRKVSNLPPCMSRWRTCPRFEDLKEQTYKILIFKDEKIETLTKRAEKAEHKIQKIKEDVILVIEELIKTTNASIKHKQEAKELASILKHIIDEKDD